MKAYIVCRTSDEATELLPAIAKKLDLKIDRHHTVPTRYLRIQNKRIFYGGGLCNIRRISTEDLTAG